MPKVRRLDSEAFAAGMFCIGGRRRYPHRFCSTSRTHAGRFVVMFANAISGKLPILA